MRLQMAERRESNFLGRDAIPDCWFIWAMLMIVSIVLCLMTIALLSSSNEMHDRFHRLLALADQDGHKEEDSPDTRAFHFLRSLQNHSSEFRDFMAEHRAKAEGDTIDSHTLEATEVSEVVTVSKDIDTFFGDHGVALLKVFNGEEVAISELPRRYYLGRSVILAFFICWALSSGVWWLKRVGYHELCDGYHAFSSCEFYGAYVLVWPGLLVLLPLLGIFYGGYGIFCLCTRGRVRRQAVALHVQPERAAGIASYHHVPAEQDAVSRQAVIGTIARAQKRTKKTVKRLLKYAHAWREESRRLAKEESNKAARELEQAQRQAASALGRWRSIEAEPEEKTISCGRAIVEGLLAHPVVCAIEVSSAGLLSIYVKTIYMKDRGRLYEIGDFALVVDFANGCMENVTCLRSTSRESKHPYWHGSTICFGDALHDLQDFLQRREYVSFIDLAYQMITRPNPGNMHFWKEIANEKQPTNAA